MTGCGVGSSRRKAERQADEKENPITYTCPMHPEVHQNQPGKCPKCSMELAPAGLDQLLVRVAGLEAGPGSVG
jgi:hypothetical protein